MTTTPEYLTIREAAQVTRRTPWRIWKAVFAGDLAAFHPGGVGARLIRPADLRAWVEGVSA